MEPGVSQTFGPIVFTGRGPLFRRTFKTRKSESPRSVRWMLPAACGTSGWKAFMKTSQTWTPEESCSLMLRFRFIEIADLTIIILVDGSGWAGVYNVLKQNGFSDFMPLMEALAVALRHGPGSGKQMAVPHRIHTYAELRQQIHHDLRIQHSDWIQPNGSPQVRLLRVTPCGAIRKCNDTESNESTPLFIACTNSHQENRHRSCWVSRISAANRTISTRLHS